jgi:hypothetical protein
VRAIGSSLVWSVGREKKIGGKVRSGKVSAVNGVKQGAVLSPVPFCVYVDNLLVALSHAGVGCLIGSTFVGALAYADDFCNYCAHGYCNAKVIGDLR